MASVCFGTLSVCRARIGKLATNGAPLNGAKNLNVTDTIISVTFALQLKAGTDYEQDNGCGDLCFAFKNPDQIKGLNVQCSFCKEDAELKQLLSGGDLITQGGTTIGWALPKVGTTPNPDGCSFEFWTKNIAGSAVDPSYPYVRYVLGKTIWTPADTTFAAGPIVHPYTGTAYENSQFGDGPAEDFPFTSDRLYQFAGDTDLPPVACGNVALVNS